MKGYNTMKNDSTILEVSQQGLHSLANVYRVGPCALAFDRQIHRFETNKELE